MSEHLYSLVAAPVWEYPIQLGISGSWEPRHRVTSFEMTPEHSAAVDWMQILVEHRDHPFTPYELELPEPPAKPGQDRIVWCYDSPFTLEENMFLALHFKFKAIVADFEVQVYGEWVDPLTSIQV